MDKENFFISQFKTDIIGDDGAVIGDLVISKDLFCEDIHFKMSWMSLKNIASKAVLINLSDSFAMNAKPKYILIGIQIPKKFSNKKLKKLAKGFKKIANKYNCKIIGGDTIAGDKLNISITVIAKAKKPIFRKGIKHKEIIAFTGDLGSSKKDLNRLLKNKKVSKNSKLLKPKLRDKFLKKSNRYMTSCMDISDGLGFELKRLSKVNNVGFKFDKKFKNRILCSGEEYELLFSIKKKYKKKIAKVAKKTNTKVTFFAKALKNRKYRCNCTPHHF